MNLSCVCVRARWRLCNSIEILTTNYRNIQQKKITFFVQCHWRVIVVIFECEKPFLWLLIIMITLRTICCCYARFPWTEPDKYCLNCSTDCVEIPAIRRNSEWWDDRTHHQFRSEYGNAYRVQKHESINRCTRVWWNCVASFYHHRILLFFFFINVPTSRTIERTITHQAVYESGQAYGWWRDRHWCRPVLTVRARERESYQARRPRHWQQKHFRRTDENDLTQTEQWTCVGLPNRPRVRWKLNKLRHWNEMRHWSRDVVYGTGRPKRPRIRTPLRSTSKPHATLIAR